MTPRCRGTGRRWVGLLAAVLLVMAPTVVSLGVSAVPAQAEDCTPGFDCQGDIFGSSISLDNGDCFWDSCGDGLQAGDVDLSDWCDATSCPFDPGQNPPDNQCPITVNPDGSITCTVTAPGPDNPAPDDCSAFSALCEDPITELPIDPTTCAPKDDPGVFFDQTNFNDASLGGTDPFPDMDPLTDPSCSDPAPPPPPSTQFGATDVAFGDSFMSGEGQGPFGDSPISSSCDVSANAWPSVVYADGQIVQKIFATSSSRPFENWACSGATIQGVYNQLSMAQADGNADSNSTGQRWAGLGMDTARVQLSVGGNDLGFGQAIRCAWKYSPERDDAHALDDNDNFCVPKPDAFRTQVNNLVPQLTQLYEAISSEPSGPTLEVAGYPLIFPGAEPGTLCGWQETGISNADQFTINQDTIILDDGIRRAAAAAQVRYIDFTTALDGVTICGVNRGVNTVDDVGGPVIGVTLLGHKGAFHPNELGHERLATAYLRNNFFPVPGASIATAADGTLVGDRFGDGVYVAAGGALWPFPNQPTLANSTAYNNENVTLEASNQVAAQLQAKPADGTVVRDDATGQAFTTSHGTLVPDSSYGTTAAVPVPDSSLAGYPLADGYFFGVSGDSSTLYESIGGAPVVVTDASHVGNPSPFGFDLISQAQFKAMRQYPRDGTFAQTSDGAVYEFIGGAPVYVSAWSNVGGAPASSPPVIDYTAINDAGSGGAFNHVRQYPADGTTAVAVVPSLSVDDPGTFYYVFAGGAPILISDWSQLGGKPDGPMTEVDYISIDNAGTGGRWNHLRQQPADDTVLQSGSTGTIYQVEGGTPEPGCHPLGSPVVIDQTALDQAGTGGVNGDFNHLNPPASKCTVSVPSSGAASPGALFDPITGNSEVYYNSGGHLAESAYVASTGQWANLGTQVFPGGGPSISGQPSAVFDSGTGNLEVYFNSGGQLAEVAFVPGTGWVNVGVIPGGSITGSPAAVFDRGDGNLEIYYNSGGKLTELAFVPSRGWVAVGAIDGAITGSPSVLAPDPADGNLEIYYNSGGKLTELAYVFQNFNNWVHVGAIGGTLTGSPRAIFDPATATLEVYYNSGGQLARDAWTPAAGWAQASIGGTISGDPAPVYDSMSGNTEIYYNSSGQLARNLHTSNDTFTGQLTIGDAITNDPAPVINPSTAKVGVYFNSGGELADDDFDPATGTFSGVHTIGNTIS